MLRKTICFDPEEWTEIQKEADRRRVGGQSRAGASSVVREAVGAQLEVPRGSDEKSVPKPFDPYTGFKIGQQDLLRQMIELESFRFRPPLREDRFIRYCENRGVRVTSGNLQRLDKVGIFKPLAKVWEPSHRMVGHPDETDGRVRLLGPDEEWSGATEERTTYAHFELQSEALEWLDEGLIWVSVANPGPETPKWQLDADDPHVVRYYSEFQCYTLDFVLRTLTVKLSDLALVDLPRNRRLLNDLAGAAARSIDAHRNAQNPRFDVVTLCQLIASCYHALTQTDRRTVTHSDGWPDYVRTWDSRRVLDLVGVEEDYIKDLHQVIGSAATQADPLSNWYDLVSYISIEKRKRLKGPALFAQTLYSMEHMLRLFYRDLTDRDLPEPPELFGPDVSRENHSKKRWIFQDLQLTLNEYHLNPNPKVVLFVEGDGEERSIPKLFSRAFGIRIDRVGIQVRNLHGVGGFEGKKSRDPRGALERLIDELHDHQTIVIILLDNEGRVAEVKGRLSQEISKRNPVRRVTRDEYIHVWKKSIELDNFKDAEIAHALTEFAEGSYDFTATDVAKARESLKGDPLGVLFNAKVSYSLNKPKLLEILFTVLSGESRAIGR